jgi:AraC-like DNA-binding protein
MATFDEIVNHLLFFGGSLALTMALVQFLQVLRDSKHFWIGVFFSCISFTGFQQYYFGAYGIPNLELSQWRGQVVMFMLGPSIFFFYKKLFYRDFEIRLNHVVHLIPAFISICVDIVMFCSTISRNTTLQDIRGIIVGNNIYYTLSAAALFSSYDVYILFKEDFIFLFKRKKNNKVNQIALFFVGMVLMIGILLFYAVAARNVRLARFICTLMILPFLFIFLVGYLNPELISIITSEVRKNLYERSLIKGLDVKVLKNRLRDIMEVDKVFCDEDLSLKRLADMLSISPHQLSEFLNKHMNISFAYYINRFRVDEAIDLMQVQPDRSITSICFSVGFNSKSAFYEAFAKFVGISPARYRRNKK